MASSEKETPNLSKMEAGKEESEEKKSHTSKVASASQSGSANRTDTRVFCPHTKIPDCLHTCTHPYHSSYSEGCLPPLIFRLDTSLPSKQSPLGLLIENGKTVEDADGAPIRNFPFLPRYISVKVSGWLLEYWMRTDTRLTYRDIKARMTAPASELPLDNTLNMRREREARTPLKLSCLTTRRGQISRKEVERVESWTPDQVSYNTTMDIEYKLVGGKKVPSRLRSKTLTSSEPRYYPLDTFLDGMQIHTPGPRIMETIELFYRLSDTATALNLPSWGDLPLEYLPTSWKPRSFPSRTKSGPRRKYMIKHITLEDDDTVELKSDTEQYENEKPATGEVDDKRNSAESEGSIYGTEYERELKFSGLPGVNWYNHSPRRPGSMANHPGKAVHGQHDTTESSVSQSILPWTPINGHKKQESPVTDIERSINAITELGKTERSMSQFGRAVRNETSRRTFSPFESSEHGQFYEDALKMNPDAELPFSWQEEPIWFNRYRFNSTGPHSIRNDMNHPLNTRTLEIMRRNNPFLPENLYNDSLPDSFEQYLNDSIRRFQGTAYPSP
ncbi:hypothetical protein DTO271G3_104 [Paecilomyces variotii]|nr:hypothetical protein DTO271G3_104 [Paecilomyces variotii]